MKVVIHDLRKVTVQSIACVCFGIHLVENYNLHLSTVKIKETIRIEKREKKLLNMQFDYWKVYGAEWTVHQIIAS